MAGPNPQMMNQPNFNPMAAAQQQNREERLAALEHENQMRRDMGYTPYNYQGYPYNYNNMPQNQQQMPPQNQQVMQPQAPTVENQPTVQTSNGEYLQGYPIEGMSQLREARVGLDGRVSIFPFMSENHIYTKQTNLDGLPEYKRFILDESFQMEEVANNTPETAKLAPVIEELKTLQAEIRSELQALREERKNESTNASTAKSEPAPASNPAVNAKRDKSNSAAKPVSKSESSNAGSAGDSVPNAKG